MTGTACSACGRAFGCGVDAGDCWCAGVDTDPDTLAALAGAYAGCLCPDCLRTQVASDAAATPRRATVRLPWPSRAGGPGRRTRRRSGAPPGGG